MNIYKHYKKYLDIVDNNSSREDGWFRNIERNISILASRVSTELYLPDSPGVANIGEKKADSDINILKRWKGGY